MKYFDIDLYKQNLAIALTAHKDQLTPTGLPYSYHVLSVTTEIINILPEEIIFFDEANIAISCALFHDIIEDTDFDLFKHIKSDLIKEGVLALTKNNSLPKNERMIDSIRRLQKLPACIQMVKLADRITNLDPPPSSWNQNKIKSYLDEAKLINSSLGSPSGVLNLKLADKIENYKQYIL